MKSVEARKIMETDNFYQLGKSAMSVWLTMVVFTDNNNEYWGGQLKLANLLNMLEPNVSRVCKELEQAGLVVKVREARSRHAGGSYKDRNAKYRLNTIDQLKGYQKGAHELSEGYTNGKTNGNSDGQAARGVTPYNPLAETSVSADECLQPPLTQGIPQVITLPFDSQYKYTPPRRQPKRKRNRQSQAEGPTTQGRPSAHSSVEPEQRRESVPLEHVSDEDDLEELLR